MKKRLITTALMFGLSSNAFANVKFEKQDDSVETKVCAIAAEQGLNKARSYVIANDLNFEKFALTLTCNGYSLSNFSRKYAGFRKTTASDNSEEQKLPVALIARQSNPASQLCVDAVLIGETLAREKHGIKTDPVVCNDRPLKKFVASFAMRDVTNNAN